MEFTPEGATAPTELPLMDVISVDPRMTTAASPIAAQAAHQRRTPVVMLSHVGRTEMLFARMSAPPAPEADASSPHGRPRL